MQFLILHGNIDTWKEKFISLKYNIYRTIRGMNEVNLDERAPYWSLITANILRGGNTAW